MTGRLPSNLKNVTVKEIDRCVEILYHAFLFINMTLLLDTLWFRVTTSLS